MNRHDMLKSAAAAEPTRNGIERATCLAASCAKMSENALSSLSAIAHFPP